MLLLCFEKTERELTKACDFQEQMNREWKKYSNWIRQGVGGWMLKAQTAEELYFFFFFFIHTEVHRCLNCHAGLLVWAQSSRKIQLLIKRDFTAAAWFLIHSCIESY